MQVRARCIAQFLALRAAGALPPDIDQMIRNLYWCARPILVLWADAVPSATSGHFLCWLPGALVQGQA